MEQFDFVRRGRSLALLFPGQGSQHVGMVKEVCAAYPDAAAALEEADDVLGFALSRLCFEGPEDDLTDTINAQPALLAAGVAVLRALASEIGGRSPAAKGPEGPVLVAGHSLGEYTALVAAGALDYADGLRLVRERGRLMRRAGQESPGRMAAVLGLDEATVRAVCADATANGGLAVLANDNCPGQIVISGDQLGMEAALAALPAAGAKKVMPLTVSIAAHSPLMAPVAAELRAAIDSTPIRTASVPLVGNTTATLIDDAQAIRAELAAQLTGSVRWTESMRTAVAAGVRRVVEVGPGEVLTGLMKRIERSSERYATQQVDGVQAAASLW